MHVVHRRSAVRRARAGRARDGQADRAAGAGRLDVQLRRGLGHVRLRQLALPQSEGTGVHEDLSDQWFEGYVKPALSGTYTLASSSEIYGKVSAVGERTYGSVPDVFGADVSSFGPKTFRLAGDRESRSTIGENALDFTVGRTQYRLGHGFLLFDGAAEGGSRGGYWTNARKAFEFAAIGRVKPGASHWSRPSTSTRTSSTRATPAAGCGAPTTSSRIGENTTFGATYMKWFADPDVKPGRDGLNVFNVRAYTAPVPAVARSVVRVRVRVGAQRRRARLERVDAAGRLRAERGRPGSRSSRIATRSSRATTRTRRRNEAFDPLFLGFYDWGTWWQGEIAGEYFLSNSNLISHLIRAHVTPTDAIGGGLMFFNFRLDQPAVGRTGGHGQGRWRSRSTPTSTGS